MAKNLNLHITVDHLKALSALKGFQQGLQATHREMASFSMATKSLISDVEKLNIATGKLDGSLKKEGTTISSTTKDIKKLVGDTLELDKANKKATESTQSLGRGAKKTTIYIDSAARAKKRAALNAAQLSTKLTLLGLSTGITTSHMTRLGLSTTLTSANLAKMQGTSVNAGAVMTKSFGGIKGILSGIGPEIRRTISLMTTLGTVAGGVALNKAKNDYIEYSDNFASLEAVIKTDTKGQKDDLKTMYSGISSRTGISTAKLMKDSTTLASGGIEIGVDDPSIKKGSEEYYIEWGKSRENFGIILEDISKFAVISQASTEEASDAVVMMGNAMGMNAKEIADPKNIKNILGILATTLDAGLGDLSEYSTQMNKFVKTGIASGLSVEQTMALFARQTKNMTTFMGGFSMKAITTALENVDKEVGAAYNKIRRDYLKPLGEGQQIFSGTEEEQAKKEKFIQQFDTKEKIKKAIYWEEETDSKGKGTGVWQKAEAETVLKKLAAYEGMAQAIGITGFSALISTNENTKKVIVDLASGGGAGFKDYERILEKFGPKDDPNKTKEENKQARIDFRKEALDKRFETLGEGFGVHYRGMVESYNNAVIAAADKMNPSLNAFADAMKSVFTGEQINMDMLNDIFKQNIKDLEKTNPMLADMVRGLQKLANYAGSGELAEDFTAVGEALSDIVKFFGMIQTAASSVWNSAPIIGLRQLLGGGPGGSSTIDIALAIGGYAALKSIFSNGGGIIGLAITKAFAGVNLMRGIEGGGKAAQFGRAIGNAIPIVGIGLTLQVMLGNYLSSVRNELEATFDRQTAISDKILADIKKAKTVGEVKEEQKKIIEQIDKPMGLELQYEKPEHVKTAVEYYSKQEGEVGDRARKIKSLLDEYGYGAGATSGEGTSLANAFAYFQKDDFENITGKELVSAIGVAAAKAFADSTIREEGVFSPLTGITQENIDASNLATLFGELAITLAKERNLIAEALEQYGTSEIRGEPKTSDKPIFKVDYTEGGTSNIFGAGLERTTIKDATHINLLSEQNLALGLNKGSTDTLIASTDLQKASTDLQKDSTDLLKISTDAQRISTDILVTGINSLVHIINNTDFSPNVNNFYSPPVQSTGTPVFQY